MVKRLHISRENIVYIVLWAILFIAPLVSVYVMNRYMGANDFDWRETWHIWRLFLAFLVVFIIHNYFLAPLLVYKHRPYAYVLSVICILLLFTLYNCVSRPHEREGHMMEREFHEQQSTQKGGTVAPVAKASRDTASFVGKPPREPLVGKPSKGSLPKDGKSFKDRGPKGRPDGLAEPDMAPRPPFGFVQGDLISLVILIGLLSLNLGVKIFFKTANDRNRLQQLEKQNIEQQLAYLKYQINPHFFMNTLNNIHALVDIDPEMAKKSILELSKMMRYLLYEADNKLVPLQREYQFIQSYISLMRLRYTDKVEIVTDAPEAIPNTLVPPLLTINFVENAFKHGVSYEEKSFIHIKITLDNNIFNFDCVNSKHAESTTEESGVGLANARKRLDLLFGENYTLEIIEQEDTYEVSLQFPMTKKNS
jgi:hypothetical protein